MAKRILIMLYEEGASELTHVNRFGSNFSLRRMVTDGNAAANAIVAAGGEAFVCDVYAKGRDIISDELTKNATKVTLAQVTKLCEEGLDGVALIGGHAMNSAWQAFASYSVNEVAWQEYRLNGKAYGDLGIATVFFGSYNIPIIAVSGDGAAVKECQTLVGNIPSAVVKTAKIRNICDSALPAELAEKRIAEACVAGMNGAENFKPYVVKPPYNVSVLYKRADYCDDAVHSYISSNFELTRESALVAEKHLDKIVGYNDLRI